MAETESKSIHKGDATLDQNAMKLTKTCSLEFGSLLWRHLTLQRKPQHGCTTTVKKVKRTINVSDYDVTSQALKQSQGLNSPKIIWKFYILMTFGVHKLVCSEPFLDYVYEV